MRKENPQPILSYSQYFIWVKYFLIGGLIYRTSCLWARRSLHRFTGEEDELYVYGKVQRRQFLYRMDKQSGKKDCQSQCGEGRKIYKKQMSGRAGLF